MGEIIMTTVVKKRKGFDILSNHAPSKSSLSAEALGVLWYLNSKPDGWKVLEENVRARFNFGRHKYLKIMKELREAGYVWKKCYRNNQGKFVYVSYIYDEPQSEKTEVRFSDHGSTAVGFSDVGKPDHIDNTEIDNTDNTPPTPQGGSGASSPDPQSDTDENHPLFDLIQYFYKAVDITPPRIKTAHYAAIGKFLKSYFGDSEITRESAERAIDMALAYAEANDLTITRPQSIQNLGPQARNHNPAETEAKGQADAMWQRIEAYLDTPASRHHDGFGKWWAVQDDLMQATIRALGGRRWIEDRPNVWDFKAAVAEVSR